MLQIFRKIFPKKERVYFISFQISYSKKIKDEEGNEKKSTGIYWGNSLLNLKEKLTYQSMRSGMESVKKQFEKNNPDLNKVDMPVVISIYEY